MFPKSDQSLLETAFVGPTSGTRMNVDQIVFLVWAQGEGEDEVSMRKRFETRNGGQVIVKTPRDTVDFIPSCFLISVTWCGSSHHPIETHTGLVSKVRIAYKCLLFLYETTSLFPQLGGVVFAR